MSLTSRTLFLLSILALSGCSADATLETTMATPTPPTPAIPAAPTLVSANALQVAVVGNGFSYDVSKGGTAFSDPVAKGLTYTVSVVGLDGSLTVQGPVITGTCASPGIAKVTVVATDGLGRQATDQFSIVTFSAGLATPVLPSTSLRYTDAAVPLPVHFRTPFNGSIATSADNTPLDNPTTDAGATLGRVLFFDSRLSGNDGTACASCHLQSLGGGDATALSVGFSQGLTGRHTPALANARFYARKRFFWDERAATLEEQVLQPIQNTTEMGLTLDALVMKLSATPYYAPLFTSAFGSPTVTSDRIARALSQYTRSMVSATSRYDKAFTATGAPNFAATFTAEEQLGEQLFRTTGCGSCHSTVVQVSDSVHNIGLDASITDIGAGNGAFKAPSLRNVAVRERFMHDGRFASIEEVIDFFDAGVKDNRGLDPRLRNPNGSVKRLGLTSAQKSELAAFLRTLTDSLFLTDVRFSDPFAIAATLPPSAPPPVPGQPPVSSAAVIIQNKAYKPPTLTVTAGTVVTWTNLDNQRHSAQFDDPAVTSTPVFTSGSRTVTMPTKAGTYTYHCAIHGNQMLGSVTVR